MRKVTTQPIQGNSSIKPIVVEPIPHAVDQVVNNTSVDGAPPIKVDLRVGDPSLVLEPILDVTLANTPTQAQESEEPYKVVTRKSKGKQVGFQRARMVNYGCNDSGRPGGARGPNPYLS